jgi:hypothetical protein
MSLRGGLSRGDGPGGGKTFAVLGAGLAFVIGWIVVVLSFGGGEEPAVPDRASAAEGERARTAGETVTDNRAAPAGVPTDAGKGGHVHHGGGGEPESITAEDPEAAIREQREGTVPEGGAVHEPGSYDPLRVDPKRGALTPRDEGRARLAAAKFVAAAYGYTGEDRDEYYQAVGETVLWPHFGGEGSGFYSSPGGEEIRRFAAQVEASGTESAAKLDRFEVEGSTEREVAGYAYFRTADSYDRYGEIEGNVTFYRQRLELTRYGATFKVSSAQEVERIER